MSHEDHQLLHDLFLGLCHQVEAPTPNYNHACTLHPPGKSGYTTANLRILILAAAEDLAQYLDHEDAAFPLAERFHRIRQEATTHG